MDQNSPRNKYGIEIQPFILVKSMIFFFVLRGLIFNLQSLEDTDECKELQLQATSNCKADHVDAYDSDCDDEATVNEIFMENLSPVGSLNDDTVSPHYDSNTLSEVPHYDTYHDSDVLNSNIQELGYIKNIISTNESYDELKGNSDVISFTDDMLTIGDDTYNYVPPPVQKDDMMLSVIEQMKSQVKNYRVRVLGYAIKDGHSKQEAYLSHQYYTVVNDSNRKLADFEKHVSSQQTQMKDLNNHIAFLKKNFETLKQESSTKYEKNIAEIVDLKKAKKELENIVFKIARQKQPELYNTVLNKEHIPVFVYDFEETLILTEESRLKNKLFPLVSVSKPKVFPKKLPSTSQVLRNSNNARDLLTKFDECIKIRTMLSPHQIGRWEQSDIKCSFKKDVISFSENLKETFKLFEKGFITEVKEMKDIFEQMVDEVDQYLQESNKSLSELQKHFAKLEEYNITLHIAFQNHKEQMILNDPDTINKQLLVKTINNQSVEIDDLKVKLIQKIEDENISKPSTSGTKIYSVTPFPKSKVILKVVEKNDLSKSVTSHFTINKIIEKCTKVLALGLLKIEIEPINAYFKNNRVVRRDYLKVTKEHVATLQELLEEARVLKPLDEHIGHASKFAEQIQELLVYVSTSCPFTQSGNEKCALATSHRKNNKPYVDASRTKHTIRTITKEHVVKQNTRNTNNTMLPSTGRLSSTNANGSKLRGNTKNDRIPQPSSRSPS
ncbi:hypothetical protein Tco_0735667 [Tanacetum coccineum]